MGVRLAGTGVGALVVVVLTFIFRAAKVPEGVDGTRQDDYRADSGDVGVGTTGEQATGSAGGTARQ